MSNQPDITKRVLSLRVSREFYRRLQKGAILRGMGFNEYVRFLIYEATEHIQLSPADHIEIAAEIEADIARQRAAGRAVKGPADEWGEGVKEQRRRRGL